jgi:CHRD domain
MHRGDVGRWAAVAGSTLVAIGIATVAIAQGSETFAARLDWVAISGSERDDVSGGGSVTASLSRSRLTLTGCFAGLPAAATRADLHQGVATGARGPLIAQLEITHGTDGTISGAIALSREQRAALLAGQLYLQLHAERGVAPDNAVLWGWLLAAQRPTDCSPAR